MTVRTLLMCILALVIVRIVARLVWLGRGKYPRTVILGPTDDAVHVAINLLAVAAFAWVLWCSP